MRPIIWLASYPRSGNTYLRALLGNYLHGRDGPVPINELPQHSLGENLQEIWRRITSKPAAERSIEEEWAARPAYVAALRALPGEGPLYVKTHTVDAYLGSRPAFEFQPDDRVLHVVRHPGDVAVSCADFYGIGLDEAVDRLLMPGLVVDSRPESGFEVLGSWAEHTLAWLAETRVPVMTLRYTELAQAPSESLARAIRFVGEQLDPDQIDKAAEYSRFDRLKAQEQVEGFVQTSPASTSGRFFREGRTGQWREVLSRDQAERLIAPNRDLIARLGL